MLNTLKHWLLKNRIAACSIAIEQSEHAARRAEQKSERLARREIELRMRLSRMQPLSHRRHVVTLPSAR